MEQLYTFFVRRHLNRVAQKCQEEGRKMQATASEVAELAQLADLNVVYRRLVRCCLFANFLDGVPS